MTSTVLSQVGPMWKLTFYKRSLALLNVCRTAYSCTWYFQKLLPCGWIWFCADNARDLGRKSWYPQASICGQNSSLNIAGKNMYGLSGNLSFPVMGVQSIHWIMGTNSSALDFWHTWNRPLCISIQRELHQCCREDFYIIEVDFACQAPSCNVSWYCNSVVIKAAAGQCQLQWHGGKFCFGWARIGLTEGTAALHCSWAETK